MPRTPIQDETARSNPFITKSISKSLLTPCRQVGLSRKKKTPNSANTSLTESNKLVCGNLETTPLSSNTHENEVKKISTDVSLTTEIREKKKVSKRLIADEEPPVAKKFCQDLEVVKKDAPETNDSLDCDTETDTLLEDNGKVEDEKEATSKSKVKSKPTPKKNKKKAKSKKLDIISEDEDKLGDQIASSVESPAKRNLRKQLSKKINVISDDETEEVSHNLKSSPKKTIKKETSECSKGDQEGEAFDGLNVKPLRTYSKKHPRVVKKLNVIEDEIYEETSNNSVNEKTIEEYQEVLAPLTEVTNQEDDEASDGSKPLKPCLKKNLRKKSKKLNVIDDDEDETYQEKHVEEEISSNNNIVNNKLNEKAVLKKTNKEPQAPLTEVTNQEDPLKASVANVHNKKTIKVKRSLSMKKSSCYDLEGVKHNSIDLIKECSISLSPIESSSSLQEDLEFVTVSNSEIKELQAQIKEKKKLLEELKRAEVYRKKHNTKELQELTALWKKGCISALNDLLPLVQSHAPMDMATLLKNLNIPEEKIALTPTGDLI